MDWEWFVRALLIARVSAAHLRHCGNAHSQWVLAHLSRYSLLTNEMRALTATLHNAIGENSWQKLSRSPNVVTFVLLWVRALIIARCLPVECVELSLLPACSTIYIGLAPIFCYKWQQANHRSCIDWCRCGSDGNCVSSMDMGIRDDIWWCNYCDRQCGCRPLSLFPGGGHIECTQRYAANVANRTTIMP